MPGEPVVRIDALSVSLDGRDVIRSLDLQVGYGEWLCILGPAGSGKSLLLELIAGRAIPHQGHLGYPAWVGFNPDAAIGVVPRFAVQLVSGNEQRRVVSRYASFHQERWHSSFGEQTTVAAFLSPRSTYGLREFEQFPSWLDVTDHQADCYQLMELLGIEYLRTRQLSALSNGEWRKLLLARALLARPRLLLLDDPLGGIDPDSRLRVSKVLTDYCKQGGPFALAMSPPERSVTGTRSEPGTTSQRRDALTVVCTTPRPDELGALTTRSVTLEAPGASVPRKPNIILRQARCSTTPAALQNQAAVVLRLRDASVRAGSTTLLDHVSFEVTRGQHWLITGPNGAGKSTLLALLLGDHPQSYVVDMEVLGLRAEPGISLFERQRQVGFMAPELATHYPASWSVRDVVLSGLNASIGQFVTVTSAHEQLAAHWLERFDLSPRSSHPLASLCEVDTRKAFLARALIRKPTLLLLDEPTQGLATHETEEMLDVLDCVVADVAPTLLMVSHHALERPRCITHHLALERGRVVHNGRLGGD